MARCRTLCKSPIRPLGQAQVTQFVLYRSTSGQLIKIAYSYTEKVESLMTRALYPGTFDPIHNGHIDIATRASAIFEEVLLAIYDAPPKKKVLFTTEERLALARTALAHLPNIRVTTYTGLTVDCARDEAAKVIIRGLRNVADFEYEHQIGWANRQMANDIELCCLFCDGNFAYLSATILKEVASLGGDCAAWAPPHVQRALVERFAELQAPPPPPRANNKGRNSKLAYRE